jgi:hypothetical protein
MKTAAVDRKGSLLVTRVGLRIGDGLHYDVWARAGVKIARAHDSSAWCLGDWIVYGQSHYERRYRDAVEVTELDYQTLRNYAWVARSFALDRRRSGLSFQHHAEVAPLPEAEQDRWLDLAERREWSRSELRRQMRGTRKKEGKASSLHVAQSIDGSPEQFERWRLAAARSDRSIESWILSRLDEAAAQVI